MTGAAGLTPARTAVATAAAAGLECAWLYMLLHVADQGFRTAVPVPALFLVYAASLAWMIALRAMIRSPLARATLSWVAWPAAAFLLLLGMFRGLGGIADAVQATVFTVLASGVLWWFGCRLGGSRTTYSRVVIGFQFGLVMLAVSLLIGYAVDADLAAATSTALVFVGLGLVATALTRTDEEGAPLFFQRGGTWWGMLLVSLALVLVLGLIAGVLFTPELMHLVARGMRALWNLFDRLLGLIAGLFPSPDSGARPDPGPGVTLPAPPEPDPGFSLALPDWLRHSLAVVVGVLFGGITLLAIWRVASQVFGMLRRAGDGTAQIESLRGALRHDVASALRRLFAWFMGLFGRRRTKPGDESPQTASIRRLYADMLRWGAKSGFPRESSQTPFEYQETLCLYAPGLEADVRSITESYVRAKYGAQPPTETELHQLRESRSRLKRP